jgi:hypothetical protein
VWEQIKKYRICISANSVFSILSVVIGEIEHRIFSPVAIDKISSEVYKRAQMMNKEIDKDVSTAKLLKQNSNLIHLHCHLKI